VLPHGGVLSTGRWRVMRGWAWPEGHGEMSRILAGADAGPKAAAAAAARLSSGVARSMRYRGRAVWRCFFADVLDGCFFLMCLTKYSF
jgi:hypothetical protein